MDDTGASPILEFPVADAGESRSHDAARIRAEDGPGVRSAMWHRGDLSKCMTATVPLATLMASGGLLLSREAFAILAAWVLASIPIGVLIGHCVRNEE